jgi:uncharacterized membrane protein YqaE (UPF0057 family)
MLYLFAIIFPPIAFFGAGKPGQGILSIILMITLIGWIPAAIWAILVVNSRNTDKRQKELLATQQTAIKAQTAAIIAATQITTPEPPAPLEEHQFSA